MTFFRPLAHSPARRLRLRGALLAVVCLGMILGLWGVFTLFMFFGTLKAARMLQFVFLSLTVLFALLAIGHLVDNEGIVKVAGWVGLICGASAIYLAMGEVLNEQFGRTVLPIGEPR